MGNKIHKLETLEIYRDSKKFVLDIYRITSKFPKQETYGITSQLRRAAASVGTNIAEGYGRYHYKEEILFNYRARGSLFECFFFLDFSREIGIISKENLCNMRNQINKLGIKINNYINYIKKQVTNT